MYKIKLFPHLIGINNIKTINLFQNKNYGAKVITLHVVQSPELDKDRKSIIRYEKRFGEFVNKHEVVAEISTGWKSTLVRATITGFIDKLFVIDGTEIECKQDLFCIRPLADLPKAEITDEIKKVIAERTKNITNNANAPEMKLDVKSKTKTSSTDANKGKMHATNNPQTSTVNSQNNLLTNTVECIGKKETVRLKNILSIPMISSDQLAQTTGRRLNIVQKDHESDEYPSSDTRTYVAEQLRKEVVNRKPIQLSETVLKTESIKSQMLNDISIPDRENITLTPNDLLITNHVNGSLIAFQRPTAETPSQSPGKTSSVTASVPSGNLSSDQRKYSQQKRNSSQPEIIRQANNVKTENNIEKKMSYKYSKNDTKVNTQSERNITPKSSNAAFKKLPIAYPKEECKATLKTNETNTKAIEVNASFKMRKKSLHVCDTVHLPEDSKPVVKKVLPHYYKGNKKLMLCDDYEEVSEKKAPSSMHYPELALPKMPKEYQNKKLSTKEVKQIENPKEFFFSKTEPVEPLHDINFFEERNPYNILSKVSCSVEAAKSSEPKLKEERKNPNTPFTKSAADFTKPPSSTQQASIKTKSLSSLTEKRIEKDSFSHKEASNKKLIMNEKKPALKSVSNLQGSKSNQKKQNLRSNMKKEVNSDERKDPKSSIKTLALRPSEYQSVERKRRSQFGKKDISKESNRSRSYSKMRNTGKLQDIEGADRFSQLSPTLKDSTSNKSLISLAEPRMDLQFSNFKADSVTNKTTSVNTPDVTKDEKALVLQTTRPKIRDPIPPSQGIKLIANNKQPKKKDTKLNICVTTDIKIKKIDKKPIIKNINQFAKDAKVKSEDTESKIKAAIQPIQADALSSGKKCEMANRRNLGKLNRQKSKIKKMNSRLKKLTDT